MDLSDLFGDEGGFAVGKKGDVDGAFPLVAAECFDELEVVAVEGAVRCRWDRGGDDGNWGSELDVGLVRGWLSRRLEG